jgi:hypothetical protein
MHAKHTATCSTTRSMSFVSQLHRYDALIHNNHRFLERTKFTFATIHSVFKTHTVPKSTIFVWCIQFSNATWGAL